MCYCFIENVPNASNSLIPVPPITRMTIPIAIRSQSSGDDNSGVGDINLFDIFLLKQDGVKSGGGPLLPTNNVRKMSWVPGNGWLAL